MDVLRNMGCPVARGERYLCPLPVPVRRAGAGRAPSLEARRDAARGSASAVHAAVHP